MRLQYLVRFFQLLDRKTEDSHRYDPSEYGESEYPITNSDIATAVFGDPEEKIKDSFKYVDTCHDEYCGSECIYSGYRFSKKMEIASYEE